MFLVFFLPRDVRRRTSIRRLRDKKNDTKQEDTKQDRADPERPAKPQILDDISRDKRPTGDTAHEEQIPSRNASTAFMNEIQILDRRKDEDLIRRHTDTADDTTSQERRVGPRRRSPDAAREKTRDGDDIDGPFPVEFRQRIDDEHAQAQRQDQPRRCLRERVDADGQLGGDLDEAGREHGTESADDAGREADDE